MGRQGERRQVGAVRRRSRGHGLARLDGTRTRATVASKVMESGETAGHSNGRRDVQTARKRSAQARSWKPGRRRQPSGARERWKPVRGETPQAARCAARQRDRPSPRWPGTPMQFGHRGICLRRIFRGQCGQGPVRLSFERLNQDCVLLSPRISCHHHAISPGRRPSNRSIGLR